MRQYKKHTPPGTPEKAKRIEIIIDLMTSLEFVSGRTVTELANRWGLSEEVLNKDVAEAARYVRRSVDRDPDEMRAQLVSQLQYLARSSAQRKQERSAIEALKAIATLLGLDAPKKLDVGGTLADLIPLAFGEAEPPDGDSPASSD